MPALIESDISIRIHHMGESLSGAMFLHDRDMVAYMLDRVGQTTLTTPSGEVVKVTAISVTDNSVKVTTTPGRIFRFRIERIGNFASDDRYEALNLAAWIREGI